MKWLPILILCPALAVSSFGFSKLGNVYTTDGTNSDVQAAITDAVDSDIVDVPAGSNTWTGAVTLSKGVHLRGAGSGRVRAVSSTSNSIGTGAKVFTIQSAKYAEWIAGVPVIANGTTLRIWATGTGKGGSYMLGTVTSLVGTTLTMDITSSSGSGTRPLWLLATEGTTTVTHSAGSNTLLAITEDTNVSPEVSGIQFTTGSGTGKLVTMNFASGGLPILIHDCWFNQSASGQDIIRNQSVNRGVLWNLSVTWTFQAASNSQFFHSVPNDRTAVWGSADTMGAADTTGLNQIYVEDCDVHGGLNASADFDNNTKVVWRYNVNNHAMMNSHGSDTSPWGVRQWEIYNNVFLFQNLTYNATYPYPMPLENHILMRGGTGIIADNVFQDINSSAWGNKVEWSFGVWSLSRWNLQDNTGKNSWSSNDGSVEEYPAPRQFGRGYITGSGVDGQGASTQGGVYVGDLSPVYTWGNTGTMGIGLSDDSVNAYTPPIDAISDYIQSGRDYYLTTEKPGYTKYEYPHPLRTDVDPAAPVNTSLPIITGVTVQGQILTSTVGTWTGSPVSTYVTQWRRCDSGGASCSDISGETGTTYTLAGADVGSTIRVDVDATNTEDTVTATSTQTAVIDGFLSPPINLRTAAIQNRRR